MQQTINELTEEIRQLRRQLTEKLAAAPSAPETTPIMVSVSAMETNPSTPKEYDDDPKGGEGTPPPPQKSNHKPKSPQKPPQPGFRNQPPLQPVPQAPKREKIQPIVLRDKT
ncbi:uncharacterized protein LOC126744741 [Anthonomus grandis grandis]|uniref:uncharacterized protein LOC126744741 n=1 Tax=Anthonomus grandis grandis TaxID=2921223 RepID=UPI0021663D92|nr:uncharacterized protein LOC126744741 [Anthonomus grandis grandis]